VDIAAGDRAVELMKESVAKAQRPEVIGGIGGFAGLFDASALAQRNHPVLATSTDGVGTKVAIAQALDRHDTIGFDLVGMLVDDLVVCGAEPLVLTDYIATGRVDPERIAAIVKGIAEACVIAGCALVGGETAEHPGLLGPDEFDLAGFGVGVVERDQVLGSHRVQAGDALVAMASSGLHSNGYSLVRRIVDGLDLAATHGLDKPLADVLLEPTRIYAKDCLALIEAVDVHAFCHITGGGLPGNLPRVLPDGLGAQVDASLWEWPAVFSWLAARGPVATDEMWRTFNCGVGMVAILAPSDVDGTLALLRDRDVDAWVMGEVVPGTGVDLS
jgi:phosphoribosylformylglycinamidine cyclo-ligase